ncbi:hypothetical protein ILYODFUR_036597 [Ilyodon furcidens]|uniref:Secreted protein n=1 Tax=Ilyodon furcidens TaxID=33524 RepID=A0ABV0SV74_9TELE
MSTTSTALFSLLLCPTLSGLCGVAGCTGIENRRTLSSPSAPEVSCSDGSSSEPLKSLSSLSGFKSSILTALCFIFLFDFKSFVGTHSALPGSSRLQSSRLCSTACTEVEGAAPSFFADCFFFL